MFSEPRKVVGPGVFRPKLASSFLDETSSAAEIVVVGRLEILRMERRVQDADERAYGGSDKAHDSFPAQWVLTNVRR